MIDPTLEASQCRARALQAAQAGAASSLDEVRRQHLRAASAWDALAAIADARAAERAKRYGAAAGGA